MTFFEICSDPLPEHRAAPSERYSKGAGRPWSNAHPGHDLTQEIAERSAFIQNSKRASNCDVALRKRGIDSKQQERRRRAIQEARAARGLPQSKL